MEQAKLAEGNKLTREIANLEYAISELSDKTRPPLSKIEIALRTIQDAMNVRTLSTEHDKYLNRVCANIKKKMVAKKTLLAKQLKAL